MGQELSPTEGVNEASRDLDLLSAREIVNLMDRENRVATEAVARIEADVARAVEMIQGSFLAGGRLIYIGAGTSGRLGVLDASECPPTFSSPPEMVVGLIAGGYGALTRAVEGAEDHPESAVKDLQKVNFSSGDCLVGIATSGRTP